MKSDIKLCLTVVALYLQGLTRSDGKVTPEMAATTAPAGTMATKPPYFKPISSCSSFTKNVNHKMEVFQPSIELWQGWLMFLGILLGSGLVAQAFRIVRKHFYGEKNATESANFDAGGTISGGLTAATIVAQWTWAATLLQSSNVASKDGVSGAFWYASGATIQILLFSMIAVQLRVRAPGAKTFLRLIHSRFGAKTHIVYVCFALTTNLIVTAMLLTGGAAVAKALIKDFSVALASIGFAVTVACYTLLGGLGAVFYVSYFCAAVILIIILYFTIQVFYLPNEYLGGSTVSVNKLLNCLMAPEGNLRRSYNTFSSKNGLIFGIINIVGNFGTVFVDQSYWQIAVAAKPKQVVYGFIMGGLTWFAVPFGMATTMGLGYLALGAATGGPLLTPEDQGAGLVPPVVAQTLLGTPGAILILLVVLLAVISTASAEVIAVTSIIVHDLFQVYFKPFRLVEDINSCILCGNARGRMANPVDKCHCNNKTSCKDCALDDITRQGYKMTIKPAYQCPTHGKYRIYMDYLNSLKSWSWMICSFALIPLTLLLDVLQIKLGWLYAFMGIAIGSAVIPICLSMFWTRLTCEGMIAGAVGGCISALIVWLGLTSRLPHGIDSEHFYQNTGDDFTMLGGNLVAILSGGLICVVVSYCTKIPIDVYEIWEYTYDIDNPLYPWAETYQSDLGLTDGNQLDNRPTFQSVYATFKKLALIANGLGTTSTIILVIIWPAAMLKLGVFSHNVFSNWILLVVVWVVLATVYIVIAPVIEETWAACKFQRKSTTDPLINHTVTGDVQRT